MFRVFLRIAVPWCFESCGCETRCNGCMGVTWGLLWGGSRSTKPGVFPCKVAAAGDEKYFVCAAGAGWVRPSLGVVRSVMAASMCFACSCTLHFHGVLEAVVAKRIEMIAWVLHGVCCGEEAGARNLVFFRVKWPQLAMKGL